MLPGAIRRHARKNGLQNQSCDGDGRSHQLWTRFRALLCQDAQRSHSLDWLYYGGVRLGKACVARPHLRHTRDQDSLSPGTMSASAPSCTNCRATLLAPEFINTAQLSPCPQCGAFLQILVFPAYFRATVRGQTAENVLVEGE